jgi:hypothetical protein
MKAGAEAHFIAGQIFTLGIAALAVVPRMPLEGPDEDGFCSIGGQLSYPFRRALLVLVAVGVVRVVACHLHWNPNEPSVLLQGMDCLLGTIHVVGQSFLCLTTAYILQTQLVNFINIDGGIPGKSLLPYLAIIFVLVTLGFVGGTLYHPNLWSLVNLAEAISCYPVLVTLRLYTSVTTAGHVSRLRRRAFKGPVLTQMLTVMELWYMFTSLLSCLAEAFKNSKENLEEIDGGPLLILMEAVRHHQDSGVDDWTRLLMHSVFLNSIDELHHLSRTETPSFSERNATYDRNSTSAREEQGLVLRRRQTDV